MGNCYKKLTTPTSEIITGNCEVIELKEWISIKINVTHKLIFCYWNDCFKLTQYRDSPNKYIHNEDKNELRKWYKYIEKLPKCNGKQESLILLKTLMVPTLEEGSTSTF